MSSTQPQSGSIRAVVFDYDDTLVRTRQIRYATLIRLAREHYSAELGTAEIDAAWGIPGDEFMRRLFGEHETDFARLWKRYNEECRHDPNEAFPGAIDFLQKCAERMPIGILSSSSRRRVLPELRETGIDERLFLQIQTAEDTEMHKPDPAVFAPWLALAERQGIAAQEIVYVGDTLNDHRAARGAGLQFVGMAHTERERDLFREAGLAFCESFEELAVVLL